MRAETVRAVAYDVGGMGDGEMLEHWGECCWKTAVMHFSDFPIRAYFPQAAAGVDGLWNLIGRHRTRQSAKHVFFAFSSSCLFLSFTVSPEPPQSRDNGYPAATSQPPPR